MEFGIVVFDINLESSGDAKTQDTISVIGMYGPYSSKTEAEDFQAFVENKYRTMYAERYGSGKYEFRLEIQPLQTAPPNAEGWL